MVEETSRKPDFKNDVKTYGTNGENLFLSLYDEDFKKKGYSVYNVTDDVRYQTVDVDFVISKDGSDLGPINEVLDDANFEKVEVKVDTRALDTGNLPYEMISHAELGWSIITRCDKVFFILAREEDDKRTAELGVWVDMKKWREFIHNKNNKKRCNFIKSEDGIADLLCRVNDLRSTGVIIKETPLNNKEF